MPATASQLTRLRMLIGDSDASMFSDTELNDLWDWAAVSHSNEALIFVQTKVYAFEVLLANAAKRVSYKQNQSTENLSDLFKHFERLKAKAEAELETLVAEQVGQVKLGTMKKVPTRKKDVPGW